MDSLPTTKIAKIDSDPSRARSDNLGAELAIYRNHEVWKLGAGFHQFFVDVKKWIIFTIHFSITTLPEYGPT
jgi:hypothetical protein